MIVKNMLNYGLAEVDDELGAKLIASGSWVDYESAPARKPRTPRAKVAPAESAE